MCAILEGWSLPSRARKLPLATQSSIPTYSKAAVLMDGLTRNHAFIDGNKRISISTAVLFLQVNSYRLTATNPELEQFAMYVTTMKPSIDEIADWFRAKTVRTKSR